MSKNVECSNQVTSSVDLIIAEKTNSLLSDLTHDFEDLRKCIRNYIPDYAVKHESIYSLEDICKIYSLCSNIVRNRDTLDYNIAYANDRDPSKPIYISPLRWCKDIKCLTDEDILYIDNYLERFNYLNHFLSATRTLNVDVHNAIHTVFKNSNGNVLNKVYAILSKASEISYSYVSNSDDKPCIECSEDFNTYCEYRWVTEDDEKYDKLFEDWLKNFKSEIPFGIYLVENGYYIDGKKSKQKKKVESKVRS